MTKFENTSNLTGAEIAEINQEMADRPTTLESATFLVNWARQRFGERLLADTSFGKDSALMWDVVALSGEDITFTFGDTKLLPPETYEQRDTLTSRYPMDLAVATPDDEDFEEVVRQKLWRSTRRQDLDRFLSVVKLEPLSRLDRRLGKKATLAAARRDQTLDREGLDYVVEQHDGTYRVYPLLDWTGPQVDDYIDSQDLPRNRLPVLYGLGAVSYRNVVYFEGKIEVVAFNSCGRNSPDSQPVYGLQGQSLEGPDLLHKYF